MNKILLPLLLFLCSSLYNSGVAQDILYLQTGDTLKGKIDKATDQFIYFYPESKNQQELKIYSVTEVLAYSYNQYKTDTKKRRGRSDTDRFFVEAAAGLGVYLGDGANFLLAPEVQDDPILAEYMKKLRLNASYTATFGVFITENIGVNLKYSYTSFENSIYVLFLDTANNTIPGYITDDIRLYYIAPGVTLHWPIRQETGYFLVDINLGYFNYKNDAVVLDKYGMSGETFCLALRASGALAISPGVYVNLSAGFISAQLAELTIAFQGQKETFELNTMEYLDASRLDFQIGLSVKF